MPVGDGLIRSSGISIKDSLKADIPERPAVPVAAEQAEAAPGRAEEEKSGQCVPDQESLTELWKAYAATMKGDARIHNTLINGKPQLIGGDRIRIQVNSETQKEFFLRNVRPGVHQHLVTKGRWPAVEFEVMVHDEGRSEKKIYTDQDKFDYLLNKNPELGQLKSRFGLDFDD